MFHLYFWTENWAFRRETIIILFLFHFKVSRLHSKNYWQKESKQNTNLVRKEMVKTSCNVLTSSDNIDIDLKTQSSNNLHKKKKALPQFQIQKAPKKKVYICHRIEEELQKKRK